MRFLDNLFYCNRLTKIPSKHHIIAKDEILKQSHDLRLLILLRASLGIAMPGSDRHVMTEKKEVIDGITGKMG